MLNQTAPCLPHTVDFQWKRLQPCYSSSNISGNSNILVTTQGNNNSNARSLASSAALSLSLFLSLSLSLLSSLSLQDNTHTSVNGWKCSHHPRVLYCVVVVQTVRARLEALPGGRKESSFIYELHLDQTHTPLSKMPLLTVFYPLFQVHCPGQSRGEAALPSEDLHVVLGLPSQMLQVQDPDKDHIQDRGERESSLELGKRRCLICQMPGTDFGEWEMCRASSSEIYYMKDLKSFE